MEKILHRISLVFLITLLSFWIASSQAQKEATKTGGSPVRSVEEKQNDTETSKAPYKISVNANLVTTDVTVTGKNLPKLQAEDFIIYDNKVPQEVAFFSYDQLPIAVALLIDSSGSVKPFFPLLKLSSILSLKNLKPEDRVALVTFDFNSRNIVELTSDRLLIAGGIRRIQAEENFTYMFKSVYETAKYLREKAAGQ